MRLRATSDVRLSRVQHPDLLLRYPMILVFSVYFDWLPFVYDSQVNGFWPIVRQFIMPITVLSLNSIGDGPRDALDPRKTQ